MQVLPEKLEQAESSAQVTVQTPHWQLREPPQGFPVGSQVLRKWVSPPVETEGVSASQPKPRRNPAKQKSQAHGLQAAIEEENPMRRGACGAERTAIRFPR
jgi:hypothetical protein